MAKDRLIYANYSLHCTEILSNLLTKNNFLVGSDFLSADTFFYVLILSCQSPHLHQSCPIPNQDQLYNCTNVSHNLTLLPYRLIG